MKQIIWQETKQYAFDKTVHAAIAVAVVLNAVKFLILYPIVLP